MSTDGPSTIAHFPKPNGKPDGRSQRRILALLSGAGRHIRWRGNLSIPAGAHPLVRQLFAAMNKDKIALRDLGARAGVDFQTISDWRYRSNPTLPTFEAVLNAAGYELRIVKRKNEA